MEERKPSSPVSDEIDVTSVFKSIGDGFRNFGLTILRGLAGLRSNFIDNKRFFGLIIVSALILGGVYSKLLKKKFYKTSMILSCDYLNSRIMKNTLEKLNLLCKEEYRGGLANEIGIDSLTANNIISFDYKPFVAEKDLIKIEVLKTQLNNVAEAKKEIVAEVIEKIDVENKHAFQIEVNIFNPKIVKSLEKSLVDYLRNNSYIKNRVDINRINLLNRKNKLHRESKKLDSLKSVIYENFQAMAKQSRQGSNNVILSDKYLTNPLEIYIQDLTLNEQILEIDRKLAVQPDFEVIDGFTSFKAPESAGLLNILAIAFAAAIAAGYISIGLRNFNNYLGTLK